MCKYKLHALVDYKGNGKKHHCQIVFSYPRIGFVNAYVMMVALC